jgi:hypothetical protein
MVNRKSYMSLIETIQQEVADEIAADGFFLNIPVLVETLGDAGSQMERALGPVNIQGGKIGAVVIVTTPTANVSWPEVGGPFFDEIPITVLVAVNPVTNNDPEAGTGASALAICEEVCSRLHQFQPQAANGPLVAERPTITRAPKGGDGEAIVHYLCRFRTLGGVQNALPQVNVVTPTVAGGLITLSCATPGAAVFYTTDGTQPNPRTGRLYLAPFASSNQTVCARAWLAGYLASAVLTLNT